MAKIIVALTFLFHFSLLASDIGFSKEKVKDAYLVLYGDKANQKMLKHENQKENPFTIQQEITLQLTVLNNILTATDKDRGQWARAALIIIHHYAHSKALLELKKLSIIR